MRNSPRAVTAATPKINVVDMSYLTATNASHAVIVSGLPELTAQNVTLRHSNIAAKYGM
ncbi:hypothetical protein [Kosakonia pseudosacchari]|uniref:hypothetical protein n=1 Tax=Kosakonia pseudosacchari TaxID=1646340 RepID=UPI0015966F9A|nr:hypothetical protein [Kosakonia pseudosacchari]